MQKWIFPNHFSHIPNGQTSRQNQHHQHDVQLWCDMIVLPFHACSRNIFRKRKQLFQPSRNSFKKGNNENCLYEQMAHFLSATKLLMARDLKERALTSFWIGRGMFPGTLASSASHFPDVFGGLSRPSFLQGSVGMAVYWTHGNGWWGKDTNELYWILVDTELPSSDAFSKWGPKWWSDA